MAKAATAFREATRALDYQERALDSLRTRATITLTLGYLTTGFLFDVSSGHTVWFWLGTLSLLGLTTAVAAVHWPVEMWVTFNAYELVSDFVDDESIDTDAMERDLAIDAQDLYDRNEDVLRNRTRLLVLGIAAAGVAILSFLGNVVVQ